MRDKGVRDTEGIKEDGGERGSLPSTGGGKE